MYRLASLIQELGEIPTSSLQVLLFTLCDKYVNNNIYHFAIVGQKPHSFEAEQDLKFLLSKNIIQQSGMSISANNNTRFARYLDMFEKLGLQRLKLDYSGKCIAPVEHDISSRKESQCGFYSIGYEGVSIDEYIRKL
ncbi:MAG: hypothetical protein K0R73_1310 [Candidatus Midichloriaceae bacterium]|nr:hypothetical protein [Candidatus Midichloriaceae bacterium]